MESSITTQAATALRSAWPTTRLCYRDVQMSRGKAEADAPESCASKWCYVDHEKCDQVRGV